MDQALTKSFFLLVESFTKLLKLENRIKFHWTLISWIKNILKNLCKATSIFKLNEITIKFKLSPLPLFLFFFSFVSSYLSFILFFIFLFLVISFFLFGKNSLILLYIFNFCFFVKSAKTYTLTLIKLGEGTLVPIGIKVAAKVCMLLSYL